MRSRPPFLTLLCAAACSIAGVGGCDRPGPKGASAPPPAQTAAAAPASVPATPPAVPAPAPATPPAGDSGRDEAPPLRMSPAVLDLGFMAPRAGGKGTVTLTNVGSEPLTIAAVTPSCKCTTTSALAGKVIAPGASESLEAVLDGAAMPQTHRAVIKIAVNGYSRVLELQLRGETAMPVRCVPSIINAVEGKPRAGRFVIESVDGKPFRLCSIGGRVPELIGHSQGDAPKSQYLVRYDLDSWQGGHPAYLAIETDRPDCPLLDIWVRTEGTIPRSIFRMKDYRINAGRIDVGGSTEVSIDMDDAGEDILAIEPGSPELQLELVGQSVKDGVRSAKVRVTPKGPRTGLVYSQVRLYGREREQPLVMFATVRAPGAEGCVGCDPLPVQPRAVDGAPQRDLSAPAGR